MPIARRPRPLSPASRIIRVPGTDQVHRIDQEKSEWLDKLPDLRTIYGGGFYDAAVEGATPTTHVQTVVSYKVPYHAYVIGWRLRFWVSGDDNTMADPSASVGYVLRLGTDFSLDLAASSVTVGPDEPFWDMARGVKGQTVGGDVALRPYGKRLPYNAILKAEIQYRRAANAVAVTDAFCADVVIFLTPVPKTVKPRFG